MEGGSKRRVNHDRELVAFDRVVEVEPCLRADARQTQPRDTFEQRGLFDEPVMDSLWIVGFSQVFQAVFGLVPTRTLAR